jgi:DNA (cytosine-5)-methyltransferase 1
MKSVELFTGAGGLALGLAGAGFRHLALVERDEDSCATLRENQSRRVRDMSSWRILQQDVEQLDFAAVPENIDLLAAGVPCQPFSIGGKHRGHEDDRNMFPATVEAVRRLKPKAILIENVRGLKRPSFAKYFGYIQLMVAYPEIGRRSSEGWFDHLSRLERYHTRGKPDGLYYRVVTQVLNAADFGVPQKRERVFIVAFRNDLHLEWSFPSCTHSQDALLWSQFITREYWEKHRVPKRLISKPYDKLTTRIERLRAGLLPFKQPWRTVRDAIGDLPRPARSRGFDEPGLTHFQIPGARPYIGHTGSALDEPAKTLKAGDHGVPGGENMLAEPDGSVRYFTIRESARLQTFPDEFVFPGSWTESMRQIGNAVPVRLAECLGKDILANLKSRLQ